ncbi:MAG: YncE family protein [Balneolaceae bacterium]
MKAKHNFFQILLAGCLAIWFTAFAPFVNFDTKSTPAEQETEDAQEVNRYLYVAVPGMSNYLDRGGHGLLVFDIDDGHRFVKRIATAGLKRVDGTPSNVKGITASTATNSVYISNLETMQRIDLETEEVVWEYQYTGGADRMAMLPDGDEIYVPSFPRNRSYMMTEHWHVVDAESGDVLETIFPGISGSHNTIYGPDGKEVYMAALRDNLMAVADTDSRTITRKIGPFSAPVRPFTINSAQTLVYANVNRLLGFEIADLKTGEVLHRIDVEDEGFDAKLDEGKFHGGGLPSHGIGLTPDETEVWVVDEDNHALHVYDNTVMPPVYKTTVELNHEPHWVTFGLDGKYVYPSTGQVIEIETREIVAQLTDEHGVSVESEKMVEIHLTADGKAVRVGDQFGIGRAAE